MEEKKDETEEKTEAVRPLPCADELTPEELDALLKRGLEDVRAGRVRPAEEAFAEMRKMFRKEEEEWKKAEP